MKLSEIKTELFTGAVITDYGIRLWSFKEKKESSKSSDNIIYIHILKTGGININCSIHNHITGEQLKEVLRVSEILQKESIQ